MRSFLIFASAAIIALLFAVPAAPASAQTEPEIMITWRAKSYAPPGFEGKTLPAVGTSIEAAFELIDQGKIVDVSKYEVRWFFGGYLWKVGLGLKSYGYTPTLYSGNDITVKVAVVGYKERPIEKSIVIPLVRPEIVIDAPYYNRELRQGLNIFRGLPYFFNIQSIGELVFNWKANNEPAVSGGNKPDVLELNIPEGGGGLQIPVSLFVQNRQEGLEFASRLANFVVR